MAQIPPDQQQLINRIAAYNRGQQGYTSPEEMMAHFAQQHAARLHGANELARAQEQIERARQRCAQRPLEQRSEGGPMSFDPLAHPFTPAPSSQAPTLQDTSQEPRQWNLTTVKRCIVTRAEYQYYGSVETVLQQKGFPTKAPEDGSILLSWFDQESGCAFYELARVQNKGELMSYMVEHFHPHREEGVERLIQFEEDDHGQ